jgi:glucose-6-phosphate dehydrogenase assembly protein OpcA
MSATATDSFWSAQDTNPGQIEAALRELLTERHHENAGYVPARVLNLVLVVDREWSGEIANRLRNVGQSHASRTIVCAVERGRTKIDAIATIAASAAPTGEQVALTRETVVLSVGPGHLRHLDTIVDPLVITDLPTVVWSPHGHAEAVEAMRAMAQVVLLDSLDEPEADDALARARSLANELYVVDMAWLRTTPWRERVAATFDPGPQRPELRMISSVSVRHQVDSGASGLLLLGWLASRLGWQCGPLVRDGRGLRGSAHARRQDVQLRLEPAPAMQVRGLEGLTLETASGRYLALDRGPGGLHAHYRNNRRQVERRWTVLGASRGEGGILGNAIRQALVRDSTYLPALEAALTMTP